MFRRMRFGHDGSATVHDRPLVLFPGCRVGDTADHPRDKLIKLFDDAPGDCGIRGRQEYVRVPRRKYFQVEAVALHQRPFNSGWLRAMARHVSRSTSLQT